MKLIPFLYNKNKEAKHQWQWPSCKQYPKTLSFRAGSEDVFKTVNSIFLDQTDCVETPESWFTSSCESATSSTVSDDQESLEMVLTRGVQSERLFFEPGKTSSILQENEKNENNANAKWEGFSFKESSSSVPFKESVMVAMESDDPYADFRRSMEEMVECHGLKDWECLEELLRWYLRVNGKKNHGLIVGAFVDLLVTKSSSLSSPSTTITNNYYNISSDYSTSYSSALSSFPSPSSPFL